MSQVLSPQVVIFALVGYFSLLLVISWFTSKNATSEDFFVAGRKSPWLLVAIGMIGASLSGVTFISIPGAVGTGQLNQSFSYMQVVLGYLVGYLVIGTVLLPLYYRLKLTTIYTYLEQRLGFYSYKTGAAFFLLSRMIGASFRLFLVAIVLHQFAFGPLGAPFFLTVLITLLLIYVYTFKGGIKTIVYTDVFQTVAMIAAVILTVKVMGEEMGMDMSELMSAVKDSPFNKVFFFEGGWEDPNNFFKQFFSGALIAIAMTGLDQDMMQKNLSCRNIKDAQKNMLTFSIILFFVNLLFLTLGAVLYIYADFRDIGTIPRPDLLFPTIAFEYLPPAGGIIFILGLVAAAYSSADSALTALTTSFCVDFLNFEKSSRTEAEKRRIRMVVHNGFSLTMLAVIVWFESIHNDAIINGLFKAAGYTYGPLLGLFAFGLLTQRKVRDKWVVLVCIACPLLSFVADKFSAQLLGGLNLGFLILALNGALTFFGLWLISIRPSPVPATS